MRTTLCCKHKFLLIFYFIYFFLFYSDYSPKHVFSISHRLTFNSKEFFKCLFLSWIFVNHWLFLHAVRFSCVVNFVDFLIYLLLMLNYIPQMDAVIFPGRLRPGKRTASIGRRLYLFSIKVISFKCFIGFEKFYFIHSEKNI